MANDGFEAWYRNPERASAESLAISYQESEEHNQRVGVKKNGVLKAKRFKSIIGAEVFIEKMEHALMIHKVDNEK